MAIRQGTARRRRHLLGTESLTGVILQGNLNGIKMRYLYAGYLMTPSCVTKNCERSWLSARKKIRCILRTVVTALAASRRQGPTASCTWLTNSCCRTEASCRKTEPALSKMAVPYHQRWITVQHGVRGPST